MENEKSLIRFKVAVFSGLGVEIAKFVVTETKKSDAEKTVEDWIAVNYPNGNVTYKIT